MKKIIHFKRKLSGSLILFLSVSAILSNLSSPLVAMQGDDRGDEKKFPVTSANLLSPHSIESFENIKQEVQVKYPKFFSGKDKLNINAVNEYRKSWLKFTGKDENVFSVLHNPALLPLLDQLKEHFISYAEQHLNHASIVNRFIREIQFYKEAENVTPAWFDKLPFRFLAATSTISPQEQDFIAHLTEPYPTLFFALQENEAWKNHESTIESMNRCKNRVLGLPTYKYSLLSLDIVQKIKEHVEKALLPQITCPIWGRGRLGVAFIIEEMLDDVFLVGVPSKKLTVHGIPSSPYGYGVHDLFHKSVDHRHFTFIQHIIDQGEKYVANGGSIQHFLSVYIPSALAKHKGIMGSLKEIFEQLICTFDQLDSRKAMLGFFWVLREEPSFPSVLYTVRNFDDILKIITEDDEGYTPTTKVLESEQQTLTENITAGVDLKDHFDTSPLDGTTQWTNEAIIEWVLKNKKVREARKYELIGYSGKNDECINEEDIVLQSIKRSPRYIDVTFVLRQGEELNYSFQTLFYTMQATHDALKILELIDIKTSLPNLSSEADPRTIAQAFIKKGEDDIDSLIRHFRKIASKFANEDISGKESLIKRYEQLYDMSNRNIFDNSQ